MSDAPRDGALGARRLARPASNALGGIYVGEHVHVHKARARARPASRARGAVDAQPQHAEPVEQAVQSPKRAQVLAKRPVDAHGQPQHADRQRGLPNELPARRRTQALDRGEQGKRRLDHTRRAHVLAEQRLGQPDVVHEHRGQNQDEQHQHRVFQLAHHAVETRGNAQLGHGNPVQQILNQPEHAQKPADETPEEGADDEQDAERIE